MYMYIIYGGSASSERCRERVETHSIIIYIITIDMYNRYMCI